MELRVKVVVRHWACCWKQIQLPDDMLAKRYSAASTVGDVWINYPWEAIDIDEHDRLAGQQPKSN